MEWDNLKTKFSNTTGKIGGNKKDKKSLHEEFTVMYIRIKTGMNTKISMVVVTKREGTETSMNEQVSDERVLKKPIKNIKYHPSR